MIDIVKDVAAVIGCIISIITLCGIIIKPIRKGAVGWIQGMIGASETSTVIHDVNDKLTGMDNKIDKLSAKFAKLDERVFENERDRIRAELSTCAAQCRRCMPLYPEEMIHIDAIYDKYTNQLKANHRGTADYDYIRAYYDSQDFTHLGDKV